MDKENEILKGVVFKSAKLQSHEVTDEDLKKINKFTTVPLNKDDVFVYKLNMADNELDDRNYEPFNINALKDLKKLYIGKTVIKDHMRKADNQVARIYDTELITSDKVTGAGEVFTTLIGKCYMVKTNSNADLITEIKAGIKKEVSTSCVPKKAVCSICGKDNMKEYCNHWWGKTYPTKDGDKTCYFTLDGAKDAHEVSFVAVPAQPRAGTVKCYGDTVMKMEDAKEEIAKEKNTENKESDELTLRVKTMDSFIFAENQKEDI